MCGSRVDSHDIPDMRNYLAARISAPEFCGRRCPRKFEGARNAGKPKAPRSLCTQRVTGVHRGSHHEVPGSPASRARCLRLAPRGPRWTSFPAFRALSTATEASTAPAGRQPGYGAAAVSPKRRNVSARQDHAAWAAAHRVYVSAPRKHSHRSPPRICDAADAPRVGRDVRIISLLWEGCQETVRYSSMLSEVESRN